MDGLIELRRSFVRPFLAVIAAATAGASGPASAQQVTATVSTGNVRAVMPLEGLGIHTSTYDNSLQFEGSPVFAQLDGLLDAAGVTTLRYPGGGYADVFHWSFTNPSLGPYNPDTGTGNGYGFTPWWGETNNFGYAAPKTDFGNFVKLLDATDSQTVITLNTGAAQEYATSSKLAVPTHAGQAKEAAAWVAYANGDAGLYGTGNDITIGVDDAGNDWRTVGYWAKLRASTASEYQSWAGAAYDPRRSFLAINRDNPVGIKYWEVGNETFGTGYYGGGQGYALDYSVPYDGTNRDHHPNLSPDHYGGVVNEFIAAMKAVDPDIKVGAVLATPPNDYSWAGSGPTGWNEQVLARTDVGLGRVADNIDFAIVHWYPSGSSATILAAPRTTIPQMLNGTTAGLDTGANAGVRDSIAAWRMDGNGNAVEIFVTETDGGGSSQTVDGLFAADTYATFLEHGVRNVDWLELHSGNSFLSEAANAPNFAYWGVQSVHLLAEPGDEFVNVVNSGPNMNDVRVHTAVQEDGTVAVMLINTSTNSRSVRVVIDGQELEISGTRYSTNGDTALAQTSIGSGLGNDFTVTVPGRNLYLYLMNPQAGLPGDFNDDEVIDAQDIDILWNVIRPELAGDDDPGADDDEDLNGDGFVNEDDVDYLLNNLLVPFTSYGDADLDGGVGGLDYTAWRERAGTGWAHGDFDGDGGVGGLDYTLWRTRPQTYPGEVGPHAGAVQGVPEPSTLVLMVLGLSAVLPSAVREYRARRRLGRR